MKPVVLGTTPVTGRGGSGPATVVTDRTVAATWPASPAGPASRLPDGTPLPVALAADPVGYLGAEHAAAFGAELGMLVWLSGGQRRLPAHCHPDRAFTLRHLGSRHGGTHAWVVVATDHPEPVVHLGFQSDVAHAAVQRWVYGRQPAELLAALNAVPVRPGDAILVPAGIPHAIGPGVFLVGVGEPGGAPVLLEWTGAGPATGVPPTVDGLSHDVALDCLDCSGWDPDRLATLYGPADDGSPRQPLLPAEADPFVRAERLRHGARLEAGLSVLVVTAGAGELRPACGPPLPLGPGDTVLVPYGAGTTTLTGELTAVRCRPPDPSAGWPPRPAL